MFFRDILRLLHNPLNNVIALETTRPLFPDVPLDVVEQFYTDHGRNDHFQQAYGHLDLDSLKWTRRKLAARAIVQCSIQEAFVHYVQQVSERIDLFAERKWKCLSHTPAVVAHWEIHHTWVRPPIFIDDRLVGGAGKLRLVEGHTRVGVLNGLLKHGIVDGSSQHEIWFGHPA